MANIKDTTLRVPNVAPQKTFEPMEQQIGQDHERVMKSEGPARQSLESAYIEIVDRPIDAEKMEMLKFMEDELLIQVSPSTNPLDEQVFQVWCNGEAEFFRRGEQKKVKRKFANILATQKVTTFTQDRRQNSKGMMEDVQIPHTGLRFPFSVLTDPHPRGADWFKYVLSQN